MTIEQLFIAEVQGMRSDFRNVSRELGEVAVQVKAVAAELTIVRDIEKRLTILETEHKTTESWVANARTNTRWLVALAVGSLLSVIAMAVNLYLRH